MNLAKELLPESEIPDINIKRGGDIPFEALKIELSLSYLIVLLVDSN